MPGQPGSPKSMNGDRVAGSSRSPARSLGCALCSVECPSQPNAVCPVPTQCSIGLQKAKSQVTSPPLGRPGDASASLPPPSWPHLMFLHSSVGFLLIGLICFTCWVASTGLATLRQREKQHSLRNISLGHVRWQVGVA